MASRAGHPAGRAFVGDCGLVPHRRFSARFLRLGTKPHAFLQPVGSLVDDLAPDDATVLPLVNPATGKCLSGSAGSDGTPLVLFACNGDVNQIWDVGSDGTIRSAACATAQRPRRSRPRRRRCWRHLT